jgi:hypothetical protein
MASRRTGSTSIVKSDVFAVEFLEILAFDGCVCGESRRSSRWRNIANLARTAPKLNAKLALEPHCSFNRLTVTIGRAVYGNRESVRADYIGPIRIRLSIRLSFLSALIAILVGRTPREYNSSV